MSEEGVQLVPAHLAHVTSWLVMRPASQLVCLTSEMGAAPIRAAGRTPSTRRQLRVRIPSGVFEVFPRRDR